MRRRRRGARFNQPRFVRLIAVGALVLWIGLLVAGVLGYEPPVDDERATTTPVHELEPRQIAGLARNRPEEAHDSDPTYAATRVTETRRARPRMTSTERESPTVAADKRAPGKSDMARLETRARTSANTVPDRVARAQFTTGIAAQEPVNRVNSVFSINGENYSMDGRPLRALYYFTEVEGMRGETVTHRWEHGGEVVAQASFDVGGDSWRIYSSEELVPEMAGDWRVVVSDAQGNVIKTDTFTYQAF